MPADERRSSPRATYRVQLHGGFDFAAAAAIAPDLADLGLSHVYTSPCLEARPGSTHGYDVVNPQKVSRELGGDDGLSSFSETLSGHVLGHVLDIVPNHMAIAGPENPWWWNVLENGPFSRYARGLGLARGAPYFTERYRTSWGPAVNLDGPGSHEVRRFFATMP